MRKLRKHVDFNVFQRFSQVVSVHTKIMDKLGKGSSALGDAAIFRSLLSVTLFDVCFNKHIVCFVWTWRWFTSFCFLQELLWRSLIHAFVSLHRQEPKKKKSTCIKWIPWFNYLYYMYENYYYLDTEFASSWRWC